MIDSRFLPWTVAEFFERNGRDKFLILVPAEQWTEGRKITPYLKKLPYRSDIYPDHKIEEEDNG